MPANQARLDASITKLVDLTGACERIFKSPIPLVYTRHSSRFLTFFNILLPLGIWPAMGEYWNHWVPSPPRHRLPPLPTSPTRCDHARSTHLPCPYPLLTLSCNPR